MARTSVFSSVPRSTSSSSGSSDAGTIGGVVIGGVFAVVLMAVCWWGIKKLLRATWERRKRNSADVVFQRIPSGPDAITPFDANQVRDGAGEYISLSAGGQVEEAEGERPVMQWPRPTGPGGHITPFSRSTEPLTTKPLKFWREEEASRRNLNSGQSSEVRPIQVVHISYTVFNLQQRQTQASMSKDSNLELVNQEPLPNPHPPTENIASGSRDSSTIPRPDENLTERQLGLLEEAQNARDALLVLQEQLPEHNSGPESIDPLEDESVAVLRRQVAVMMNQMSRIEAQMDSGFTSEPPPEYVEYAEETGHPTASF
ncbi:hypothetical protein D9757_007108 [Collybiopsis confluens]|uniref:Uncharacterized protein n=1 Tax=Collybiopsis confluens TaxID=2823264 RepID=A0A8H5HCH7_9AGAR|nr:hypothetical protein D9757_007108 [Collybiopsis confluens]